jgi:serine acetyltransferase
MSTTAEPQRQLTASVIVPTRDRLSRVRRLMSRLEDQTLAPSRFEVIVVDDGSAVDVRDHLLPAQHHFALKVERQEHAGAAAARQRGADQATGDVLVFVDDDMELPPHFLDAHLDHHAADDRLVVLGVMRQGQPPGRSSLVARYHSGIGERLARSVGDGRRLTGQFLYSGNVSMRRALFQEAGGFDSGLRLLEDAELGIRLEKAGARFTLSHEAFNVHWPEPLTPAAWMDRSLDDGVHWSRVADMHPGVPTANPWHFLELVNPLSRPLLTLSALAPAPAALLARSALRTASAVDAAGLERVALAGATFAYGVQVFRGVGRETGGGRATLRGYREFRRGLQELRRGETGSPGPFRELVDAIAEDHRALVLTRARYGPSEVGSAPAAFVANIGFQLAVAYRVMRYLRALELPLATRVMGRSIRHLYGADLHWDSDLAPGLVFVHGFGIAISGAARTGPGCILSQNVTLGTSRDPETGRVGAPDLRENVVVGPGAALIGPIVVGANSKVMANCTVVRSVPPDTIVEAPAPVLRPRSAREAGNDAGTS